MNKLYSHNLKFTNKTRYNIIYSEDKSDGDLGIFKIFDPKLPSGFWWLWDVANRYTIFCIHVNVEKILPWVQPYVTDPLPSNTLPRTYVMRNSTLLCWLNSLVYPTQTVFRPIRCICRSKMPIRKSRKRAGCSRWQPMDAYTHFSDTVAISIRSFPRGNRSAKRRKI